MNRLAPEPRKSILRMAGKICAAITALHLACIGIPLRADDAKPQPIKLPGIENAFRVTKRIIAGSQPRESDAFAALAKAGVKTIISVDGEKPWVEEAEKHGMRYVHLPFGYDGISATRIAELAKAAAPGTGKIFVHCHHGKHRGPAAAAVICEATADWTPAQAEAWLKQAGTSDEYPGLYRAVREFRAPTAEQLATVGPLPSVAKTPPLVDAMVAIGDWFDLLKGELPGDWNAKGTTDRRLATHTARALEESLHELARTGDMASRPEDFRRLLADSEQSVTTLLDTTHHDDASATVDLARALKNVTQSCAACHKVYRNEKK